MWNSGKLNLQHNIPKYSSGSPKKHTKERKEKRTVTKAELRARYLRELQNVVSRIALFNRIQNKPEQMRHLQCIVSSLNYCLSYKPGNHVLRKQQAEINEVLRCVIAKIDKLPAITLFISEHYIRSGGK
ncbi:MAG: hypothetical protein H7A34_07445 [bacterium]|nr:hypothetical protein [bacterium]